MRPNRLSRFPTAMEGIAFDADLYGAAGSRFEGYHTSIPASGEEDDPPAAGPTVLPRLALASITGYDAALPGDDHEDHAATSTTKPRRIIDRENEYRRRRLYRCMSPQRHDAFAAGEATPDPAVRTYADAMRENRLQHRQEEVLREIARIKEEQKQQPVKRRAVAMAKNASSAWEDDDAPDEKQRSRWDDDEPPRKQRSRWDDDNDDETPKKKQSILPRGWSRLGCDDETPLGAEYLATPTPAASQVAAIGATSPELYLPWERDIEEERSRPLTDDDLDAMFPQKGYRIIEPPASYQPIHTPARRLLATTPTPLCKPLYALPPGGVQLGFLGHMP